ncbi:hypothetical protein OY11_18750 [Salmonella enterica]|nr:hypothetical protein [Salmonella enterica]
MTEQALMIESVIRRYQSASLQDITEQCLLSIEEAEFILEQMICCNMVCKVPPDRYKLTYK